MTDRIKRAAELLAYDEQYKAEGTVIAGIDEVGRGPLAGNVVTACVVMPAEPLIIWVDDSKKLSESRREKVYEEIMNTALYVGIGQVSPQEIDEINILQATRKAMRMAAENVPAGLFLIDAHSYCIAAASIVAKVVRDRQMRELDALYPQYGFARNKGYGTKEHIEALRRFGPCPEHRRSFIGHFI